MRHRTTVRIGPAWRRSAAPISGSSPRWCAVGANAIFQPSGGTDCLCAAYEVKAFRERRAERQNGVAKDGAQIFRGGARSHGGEEAAGGVTWISPENEAVSVYAGAVPSALRPESRPLSEGAA